MANEYILTAQLRKNETTPLIFVPPDTARSWRVHSWRFAPPPEAMRLLVLWEAAEDSKE